MSFSKTVKIWIVFGILVIGFVGCSPLKPCKVVKVVSFKIAESKGFGVTINTDLELLNPNRKSLTIRTADIDVFVEGVYLGKLLVPENLTIPPNENYLAQLSIEISFNSLLTAGKSVMRKIRSQSFEVTFKGKLEVRYLFFNKELLIDATNKVEL